MPRFPRAAPGPGLAIGNVRPPPSAGGLPFQKIGLPELFADTPTPGVTAPIAVLAGNGGSISAQATTMNTAAAPPGSVQGPGQLRILIDQEEMLANYQGGGWLLQRGIAGTQGAHSDGAAVYALLTAGSVSNSNQFSSPYSTPDTVVLTPEMFGAKGDGVITAGSGVGGSITGTDDALAFRAMMAKADQSLAAGISVTLLFGGKNYFLNSAPTQSGMGNAIVPLPTAGYNTPAKLGAIGNNIPFDVPVLSILAVPGMTRLCSARTDTYSPNFGAPSILGGPTPEYLHNNGISDVSVPLRLDTRGVTFVAPDQPTISGIDKATYTSSHVEDLRFFTTTTLTFLTSGNPPTNRPPSTAFALRNPVGHAMESRNSIYRLCINGWGVGMVVANHVVAIDVVMNWVNAMVAFDEYATKVFGAVSNAPTTLLYIWCTGTQYFVSGYSGASGLVSLTSDNPRNLFGIMGNVPFTSPWTLTADFLDANLLIAGDLSTYKWSNLFSYGGNPPASSGKSQLLSTRSLDQSTVSGTAVLAAGTVTVTTGAAANVTSASRIKCGILTPGGTTGATFVSAQSAGSVTFKSTSATDTSTIWYEVDWPD